MPDDQQQADTPQGQQQGDTSAGSKNTDTQTPGPVPYERFKEVNDQLAELRQFKADQERAAADAKKAQSDAEAARLAEQGEFKKLAEQAEARAKDLEPHKVTAERYGAALTKLLEAERKDLPKHVLTLLDKLDPAEQLEYIAENRAEISAKPNPPNVNAKDGGSQSDGQKWTDAQKKEMAAIYGVRPEYLPG